MEIKSKFSFIFNPYTAMILGVGLGLNGIVWNTLMFWYFMLPFAIMSGIAAVWDEKYGK